MLTTTGPQSLSADDQIPIFDGHIHYSEGVRKRFPPKRALELMDEAGIDRCLVSSTPTDGTERLYALAPKRISHAAEVGD